MKLEHNFDINFESLNYLEEHVTSPIWDLLYQNFEEIPKNCKVKITLEFSLR
mgnify:CR=1 FL=1